MPRFTLTETERSLFGTALALEAQARSLALPDSLIAVANTTGPELRALIQNRLNLMKAEQQAGLAAVDTNAAAQKLHIQANIAGIDSVLAKL